MGAGNLGRRDPGLRWTQRRAHPRRPRAARERARGRRPRPAADARGRDAGRHLRPLHLLARRRGRDGHDLRRTGGAYAEPLAAPVPHEVAAAHATAAAGRLFALERAGELTVARRIADVDACARRGRPAGRRPRHGGRRGDRPRPRSAARLARDGPALARPGLEPRQRLRHRRPVRLPLLAGHRPGPHRRGRRPGPGLRRARHPRRPQPHERTGLLGHRRSSRPGRWSPATPAPTPSPQPPATSPTLSSTRSARAAAWSGSSTPPSSSAPTSPTTPTRRSRRSPTTPATSPTGSASSTSPSAPTSTAPRSPPRSATSPACRSSSTPSAPSASPTPELEAIAWHNWRRVLDAWWR